MSTACKGTDASQPEEYDFTSRLVLTKLWHAYQNQSKGQKIFLLMILSCIPLFVPWLFSFYQLYTEKRDANPDYDWPSFWDLRTAATSCVLCFVLRSLIVQFITPISYSLMRESYKGDEREDRAKRSAFCGFKAVYFVSITVVGYLVMKEASWFPAVMGGSGDAGTAFDDWPYMSHETYPLLKGYMMIQLGYHTFSLFTHMTATSRNDYMEFLLHHIATIVLIMCGYMMNYCPMSSLIMIIHDVVDIWIYIVKALIDTRYTNFAFLFWVVLMFTFAYCRLYVFPFHLIWYSMWFNQKPENIPGFWLMYMLLHILLILHFYWYFLLIKGGYTYLTKGKATDFVKIAKKPEERKD